MTEEILEIKNAITKIRIQTIVFDSPLDIILKACEKYIKILEEKYNLEVNHDMIIKRNKTFIDLLTTQDQPTGE